MIALNIETAIAVALIAVCYSHALTEPDMILSDWFKYLEKRLMFKTYFVNKFYEGNLQHYEAAADAAAVDRYYDYNWLFKLMIACEKCIAGQFAFWLYLIDHNYSYLPLDHLTLVCEAIILSHFIKSIYVWLTKMANS